MKKQYMKKIFFTLLGVAALCVMTAGCSGDHSGSENKQTEFETDSIAAEKLKMEHYYDSVFDLSAHYAYDVFKRRLKMDSVDVMSRGVKYPVIINGYLVINNESDFKEHYRILFSDSVKSVIYNAKDITYMRPRTVTFLDSGNIYLDDDGNLVSYHYETEGIRAYINKRKEEDKALLHPSLRDFEMPEVYFETMNHKVRVDQCKDTLRLAAWLINKSVSSKPDLMLYGEVHYDGSCGNRDYLFYCGNLVYVVSITVCEYESGTPAALFECLHIEKKLDDLYPNGKPDIFHHRFSEASVTCYPDYRTEGFADIRDDWR